MTQSPPTIFCFACGGTIDARAEICPKCGVRQRTAPAMQQSPHLKRAADRKLAAGLCGILVGALGVHKFVLGANTAGIIMLLVTVLTCGFGGIVMGPIGLIEGIIYLTKSDEEFDAIYIRGQREWF